MTRRPAGKFATSVATVTTDDSDIDIHWIMKAKEEQVVVSTIAPGDGKNYPELGDIVTLHYQEVDPRTDEIIESSRLLGEPITFIVGDWQMVDPGWDEAVMKMSHGETARIVISSTIKHGKLTDDDTVMVMELLQVNGEDFDESKRDMSKVVQSTNPATEFEHLSTYQVF